MQSHNAVQKSGCPLLLTDQPQLSSNALCRFTLLGKPFFLCKTDCPEKDKTRAGTALVTFTSATTGAPWGLCLSEQQLMQPALAVADCIAPYGITKHLCLLPQSILLEQVSLGLFFKPIPVEQQIFAETIQFEPAW